MSRSDGARQWATVLSELADVRVVVEWERPSWRVRWTDGPTRMALMDRAAALSQYGVGTPLHARDMLFSRSSSGLARAIAWLTLADRADRSETVDLVEQAVEDTGYPQARVADAALAAADLLTRLAGGQSVDMGRLLAGASPPVRPRPLSGPAPDLAGQVISYRWPVGGPPTQLLGASASPAIPASLAGSPADTPRVCAQCGKQLPAARGRGRPARFCGGACRVAAHRAGHREQQDA